MLTSKRTIFRERALRHYMQSSEENVLPRFISPPVIIFLWCLLGLLLASSSIAWFWRLPTYITGVGEVNVGAAQAHQKVLIVVLLPANQLTSLHSGLPVQLRVSPNGPQWQQTITAVMPRIMSPAEVRRHFGLDGAAALLAREPSAIVLIQSNTRLSVDAYAGSIVQAQIQIGFRRVISLLPGLGNLGGA